MDRNTTTLLIVDDHPVVRAGLTSMFNTYEDMHVAGSVATGEQALAVLNDVVPDVVLLDLRLEKESGLDVLSKLKKRCPELPVIILTSFETQEDIYRAVERGASGYLLKSSSEEELIASVRRVRDGGKHFSQDVAESLSDRLVHHQLTPREVDVLQMVALGLSNKEVATKLNLSSNTVRNHLNHLMEKMEVSDRTEAVVKALRRGIVSLS